MYHSMNIMDFNTIKILKYAGLMLCYLTYFGIWILGINAFSLLPVPGLVDGAPEGGAGSEPAGVCAVGTLQVAARPLQTAAGTRAGGSAGPVQR